MTDEQLRAWRKALAEKNKTLRNKRGKRDPWRRAQLGIRVQPRKDRQDDQEG